MFTLRNLAIALTTACLLTTTAANATTFSSTHRFFVQIHFDGIAFDREVAGVYAHVGSLTRQAGWRGGQLFWDDVQHVQMERVGDHFFARAEVNGSSGYEYQYCLGATIQYWVYFADGTSMVTDAASVPTIDRVSFSNSEDSMREYEEELNRQRTNLDRIEDTERTQAIETVFTAVG
jgi:hypothetical protein